MSQTSAWTWSREYGKYYRIKGYDSQGNAVYDWDDSSSSSAVSSNTQQTTIITASSEQNGEAALSRNRADSHVIDPNMAPAASDQIRPSLTFTGTPERGWYETLDTRYRIRTSREAHDYFHKGRVLAMLWAETLGATANVTRRNGTENTAITEGRFGEGVYSQIRRFVVVEVNRREHFFYAIAITTYGNQGVNKRGCNAGDHSIVYLKGKQPVQIDGEDARGLVKDPIMIEPSDPQEEMHLASRLRYSKIYSIEWNVKTRDIGVVAKHDRTKLLKYYKESQASGFDSDSAEEAEPPQSQPGALGGSNYDTQSSSSSSHHRSQPNQHTQLHPQYPYYQHGPNQSQHSYNQQQYQHQRQHQPQSQHHQMAYPGYNSSYAPYQ